VPASRNTTLGTIQLPSFFHIVDDTVNENEESFVLVAEVGGDTPDDAVCFKRHINDTTCHGRVGATLIVISDDDGLHVLLLRVKILCIHSFRHYIHWIQPEKSDSIRE
jgi:hypothetical protein